MSELREETTAAELMIPPALGEAMLLLLLLLLAIPGGRELVVDPKEEGMLAPITDPKERPPIALSPANTLIL